MEKVGSCEWGWKILLNNLSDEVSDMGLLLEFFLISSNETPLYIITFEATGFTNFQSTSPPKLFIRLR